MEEVTSNEILAGYLDRGVDTVMEQRNLAKLVKKCTDQTLTDDQINTLYAIISNAHDESNWRQVDANLKELKFQSVWNETADSTSLNDDKISKLTKSLNGLNNSIKEEVKYLKNTYEELILNLTQQVEELDETPLIQDPNLKLLEEVDAKLKELEDKLTR